MPPTTKTPAAMGRDDMNAKIAETKKAVEKIWGLPVTVNVRPNKRQMVPEGEHVPDEVVYNTQIEAEIYVPGPGQLAEEAKLAAERAAQEQAAKDAATESVPRAKRGKAK